MAIGGTLGGTHLHVLRSTKTGSSISVINQWQSVALGGTHLHVLMSTKIGSSISVIEPSRFQKAPVDLWGEGVGGAK